MLGWNARQCSPVFTRWHYCLSPRWQRRNLFRRFLCKYNLKWNANIYCLAEEWICQSFYLIFYCGQTNVESWVAVFIDSGSVSIIFKLWYYNFQFKMLWHRISVQMFRVQSRIRVESRSKNASTNITNDPALPDSPDRSDLAGDASGWGGIKLSVRGLPFR